MSVKPGCERTVHQREERVGSRPNGAADAGPGRFGTAFTEPEVNARPSVPGERHSTKELPRKLLAGDVFQNRFAHSKIYVERQRRAKTRLKNRKRAQTGKAHKACHHNNRNGEWRAPCFACTPGRVCRELKIQLKEQVNPWNQSFIGANYFNRCDPTWTPRLFDFPWRAWRVHLRMYQSPAHNATRVTKQS